MRIQIKILLLDDDWDTLEFMGEDLANAGFSNIEMFTDIKEYENSFTGKGQVAIIDHILGGIEVGYDVMDRIISNNKGMVRPEFIIVSGNHDPSVYSEYTRRGIHAYIDKNKRGIFKEKLIEATKGAVEKVSRMVEYFEKWEVM